jgi:lysozyme family protein
MELFRKAMKFTSKWEGGYVNDPQDPGGETKYGISKRAYPKEDIKNLTIDRAYELYKRDYWDKCGCDNYDFPLACSVFDAAVNCGVKRALGWLEVAHSAEAFNLMRERYYNVLVEKRPTLGKFKKGWMNRLNDLRKYIIQ